MEYTIIGAPRSRAWRVMWTLEELGQPYALQSVLPHSPEIRAHNANGRIPALVVLENGETHSLNDSLAIIQFLADRHGANKLTAPAGSIERAHIDSMLHFANSQLDAACWLFSKHKFVLPEDQRIAGNCDLAMREFDRAVAELGSHLSDGRAYLTGADFTLADIVAGHCLQWGQRANGWALPDGVVSAYWQRLQERDGFQAATTRTLQEISQ